MEATANTAPFVFPVTLELKQKIRVAAAHKNIPMAEWARQTLDHAADEQEKERALQAEEEAA